MERVEKCTDPFGILVDEWLTTDQAVADEQRVPRDELEGRHLHGERVGDRWQHCDFELERCLDASTAWKAEDPLVVDDRDVRVPALLDIDDSRRGASERVGDQLLANASHALIVRVAPDRRETLDLTSGSGVLLRLASRHGVGDANCTVTKVVALMSMSLDGYVAD